MNRDLVYVNWTDGEFVKAKDAVAETSLPYVLTPKTLVYTTAHQKVVSLKELVRDTSATSVFGYAPFPAGVVPNVLTAAKEWRLSKAPPVMLQVAAAAAAQKLENTFAGFFVIVDPGKKMIQPVGWGLANRKQYSLKAMDDWKLD